MHPIFSAALRRPDLLVDHASNYVALAKEEVSQTLHGVLKRVIGGAVAAVALILALGLTGVAIMLGMLDGFAWSLVIVPGVAWLICAIGVAVAVQPGVAAGVQEMKHQLDEDRTALKVAGESHRG